MSLDQFQDDQQAALADASRRIAPDLTAGFGDTLDNAITVGTQWHNSARYQYAKEAAMADYIQGVRNVTGETLPNPAYLIGGASLDEFNEKQSKIAEAHPQLDLQPLSAQAIDAMTTRQMREAHTAKIAMDQRERTWGGTAGNVLGSIAASFTDPVMLATLPLGGVGELGILGRAAEFGAINAGVEAAIDLPTMAAGERAVPGSSAEIPREIASAGLFGAALGGTFGALGRYLKARTVSTTARDAANVGASEAQLNASNVFPTAAGEMAGRDAVTQAVTQAAKGEPITAGKGFDPAHVEAFAESVGAHDPEAMARAGDEALRPITSDEIPDVEHFDPVPNFDEDTATYWERRLEAATPEERAALGATDAEAATIEPAAAGLTTGQPRDSQMPLQPVDTAALADEPATYEAVQRNLDRIRLESPDAEFSTQTRLPDGTYQLVTRKLEDVLNEIDDMHMTGKELLACATGMIAAE